MAAALPRGLALLVCATDGGGGAVTAPLVRRLRQDGAAVTVIAGAATVGRYDDSMAASVRTTPVDSLDAATALLDVWRPAALIVGTTRYLSPERWLTRAARHKGIPTLAILDDWSNYRLRFLGRDDDWLPDRVCCPDRQAVDEAIAAGLPADRLVATGSPAQADAAERRQAARDHPPPRPAFLPSDRPLILFLSETHVADFGDSPERDGPLGAYLGYTELTVRAALAEPLTSLGVVLEKLHPADERRFAPPVGAPADRWLIAPRCLLTDLLWHADLVVGMKSTALLDSVLFGRPTLVFQPGLRGADPCTASRLGLAPLVCEPDRLLVTARALLARGPVTPPRPSFAAADAVDQVLAQLTRLLEREAA